MRFLHGPMAMRQYPKEFQSNDFLVQCYKRLCFFFIIIIVKKMLDLWMSCDILNTLNDSLLKEIKNHALEVVRGQRCSMMIVVTVVSLFLVLDVIKIGHHFRGERKTFQIVSNEFYTLPFIYTLYYYKCLFCHSTFKKLHPFYAYYVLMISAMTRKSINNAKINIFYLYYSIKLYSTLSVYLSAIQFMHLNDDFYLFILHFILFHSRVK